jgi:lipoprotein-releasing system permease protein
MILNRYEQMIARRYLLPGKGEGFIFLVAAISLAAVALGVAALIIVMSVMNGFRAELFDKIVGLNGHAIVQGYEGRLSDWQRIASAARATPGVISALPLIEQPLMASANGRVEGILIRGMRPEDLRTNKIINSNVKSGSMATITPGSGKVAIGSQLAQALGSVPRIVTYTVGAIFEVGVYDYDKAYVVMPMEDAQTLLMMGDQVGMIEIQVSDPDKVGDTLASLNSVVRGKGIIVDWRQMNSALFSALEVERIAMFVVLSLIVVVAVFNILSSLIMLVRAKTRDIAILRTMGASRAAMMKIFVTVGVTIGTLGIFAGVILGAIFLYFRQGVVDAIQAMTGQNLWDPSVRVLADLPSKTDPVEVTAIVVTAIILSFLATLYPAWKAASTDPVQVLRYD